MHRRKKKDKGKDARNKKEFNNKIEKDILELTS
jgi:hypothetical protein